MTDTAKMTDMANMSNTEDKEHFESQELEHLSNIEDELVQIKERTPTPKRAFLYGVLQGGGAVIGGVAAVALIGWALAFFGVIPGLANIAHYIQTIVDKTGR